MPAYILERTIGFEPISSAWKAEMLPLHQARLVDMERIELSSTKCKSVILPLDDTPIFKEQWWVVQESNLLQ